MAKIINFPNLHTTTEEFLQEAAELMKEHGVECFLIAGKAKDGIVVTGYHECDFGTRQEICSHIQLDIIDQMILSNLERYE